MYSSLSLYLDTRCGVSTIKESTVESTLCALYKTVRPWLTKHSCWPGSLFSVKPHPRDATIQIKQKNTHQKHFKCNRFSSVCFFINFVLVFYILAFCGDLYCAQITPVTPRECAYLVYICKSKTSLFWYFIKICHLYQCWILNSDTISNVLCIRTGLSLKKMQCNNVY